MLSVKNKDSESMIVYKGDKFLNCRHILTEEQYMKVYKENKYLIENAKLFIDYLFSFIKEKNFIVVLTDGQANILEVAGGEFIQQKSKKQLNFVKGGMLSESFVGNTAISMAIKKKCPIQFLGDEHENPKHKDWSCYAAPILHGNEVIGVFCLTEYNKNLNENALGMVLASAKGIENQIKHQQKSLIIEEQNKYQNAIVESISEGFLTIDKHGIVTYINDKGAKLLAVNRKTCIGKYIGEIVPFKPIILEVLETKKGYTDREYVLENRVGTKMHLLKTATPIRDENGEIIGVIDIFKEIKNVKKIVNKIVGARANFTFEDIIGKNPKFLESIRMAKMASQSSSNILIQGESGTGKELFAHSIHNESSRKNGPFVAINCAAIPMELIESELFGYAEGSFTGGIKGGRPGKFELANGGTLFLDEIGEMPISIQPKLLRVLQDGKVVRVGGDNVFDVDVRIIAATNKRLEEECENNTFRWDMYYRLNVVTINIPSLRERKEDIRETAYYLMGKINARLGTEIKGISDKAMKLLENYNWKGNVRELENVIERAINICTADELDTTHLPRSFDILEKEDNPIDKELVEMLSLQEMENNFITKILKQCNGNISQAAKVLNITRNTLYNKIEKHNLSF